MAYVVDPPAYIVDTALAYLVDTAQCDFVITTDPEFSILLRNGHYWCGPVAVADFLHDALLLKSIQFFAYGTLDSNGYWTGLEKLRLGSWLHLQSGFVGLNCTQPF